MKFFSKSSQGALVDRSQVNKDYYEFNKTVLHGFPAQPSSLAYDNYHKLLAIGTKNGTVQIYGKPGVEFHFEFEEDVEVTKLLFIPNKGQLVCLCSNFSLHLLQISYQLEQLGVQILHSYNKFSNDQDEAITTISISNSGSIVFIGTKNGNVYILDLIDFKVKDPVVSQEKILKAISGEAIKKPGSVESVEEKPNSNGKILIGFNRSLIALWDYQNQALVNHFLIEQQLESLSWNSDGERFISSHNDGSYLTWNADEEQQSHTPKLVYGPFPCKAIKKILWNSTKNGEYFFFSGGLPRASYGEKEAVSIIFSNSENFNDNSEKNHVLDFTSKVVDFLIISSEENIPEALVVLVEEEIVLIDLTHPDWLQYKLPYLSCLHSSPITCSQHYSNVNVDICNRIIEAGKNDCNIKYSTNEWPIKGGISKYQSSTESHDLLITGHEDGSVRFWDASTTSLKHLYTISTSKIFLSNDDDIALIDSEDHDEDFQNEWPPFRKIGHFDPYSDDHRFAIRKIVLCPIKGILAAGGTAGQLVIFELQEKAAEFNVNNCKLNLVDDKDGFIWKGHSMLPVCTTKLKFSAGYQPSSLLQINPPAALTALTISSQWQVIAVGTAHGFGLYDYTSKSVLVCKTTLKQSGHSSVAGGEALISRRKSFKKSLRESFRRLRKGRSQKGKRTTGANPTKTTELNKLSKYEEPETKPVERQIEARTEADMMSSMVRYLYFCSSVIVNNMLYPSFWVGTNSGTVFIYILTSDKNTSSGTCWQLAKEVQLKHKAPIVFIRLLDSNGAPLFENNTEHEKHTFNRVLICSEEQFKLFSLPNFKTLHKFKLTAHEGARVRKIELGLFTNKTNENQSEYSLMCLTNLGEVNVFSLHDFKRKYKNLILKKEDINGITSLLFTKFGEGFYLKSSSEYQRFSLSAKRTNFPECFIQLPEMEETIEDESDEEDEEEESEENEEDETVSESKLNEEPKQGDTNDEQPQDNTELTTDLNSSQSTASNHNQSTLNNTVESVIDHLSVEATEGDKVKNNRVPTSNTNGSITMDNA